MNEIARKVYEFKFSDCYRHNKTCAAFDEFVKDGIENGTLPDCLQKRQPIESGVPYLPRPRHDIPHLMSNYPLTFFTK